MKVIHCVCRSKPLFYVFNPNGFYFTHILICVVQNKALRFSKLTFDVRENPCVIRLPSKIPSFTHSHGGAWNAFLKALGSQLIQTASFFPLLFLVDKSAFAFLLLLTPPFLRSGSGLSVMSGFWVFAVSFPLFNEFVVSLPVLVVEESFLSEAEEPSHPGALIVSIHAGHVQYQCWL